MKNEEIQQFIRAFKDFMKHSEVEELYYEGRKSAEEYANLYLEQKAAELEITVDYYLAEFV